MPAWNAATRQTLTRSELYDGLRRHLPAFLDDRRIVQPKGKNTKESVAWRLERATVADLMLWLAEEQDGR